MDRTVRGNREYKALIGDAPEAALAGLREQAPDLYESLITGSFGGPLARAELSRQTREMATVAILAALGGAEGPLAAHTAAALHNGVDASELLALLEHVSVYAGMPRALGALRVVGDVLARAQLPSPATLTTVAVGDHETVVASRGDSGPPVVLLHALGLDWRMWDAVMVSLAQSRRVFAYDIRGHGRAAGSPAPFTMDDAAADLVAVLDALGLDRAHVVGLSYGGGIAQTAAVHHPERFASLALLATTDFPFDAFEVRARSGETDGMEAQIVPSLTRWFTPAALAVDAWGVRYAREQVRRADPRDWAAAWRSFIGLDVQGRLAGFGAPTLVLAGELDASTTPQIMSAIAQAIDGAEYRELPGTPHMMSLERPELVSQALGAFLPAGGAFEVSEPGR
ncbi:MAG TPA: alpha/beta fold hydrolase [Solirubrobacteraceae bacterium]|nr:alpha/beta fold hydrolase [Solirubrobacteraceae bacterium]